MANTKSHPGFKAVAKKIQKSEGVSARAAAAILASSSRKAVANGAKNKKLLKVKG